MRVDCPHMSDHALPPPSGHHPLPPPSGHHPLPPPPSPLTQYTAGEESKRPSWKRAWVLVTTGVLVVLVIIGAVAGGGDDKKDESSAPAAVPTKSGSTAATTKETKPPTTAAPTTRPAPTTQPAPTTTAAPKPTAPPPAFSGDGTKLVGADIQPGIYRARGEVSGCYWEREKGTSGEFEDILANENVNGHTIVQVLRSDAALKVQQCGAWETLTPFFVPLQEFGEGTWAVGAEIAPGRYRASGSGCYWARLRNFTGDFNAIITNDNNANPVVTIAATDRGFTSARCGTWHRV